MAGSFRLTAIILASVLSNVAGAATHPPSVHDADPVVVEVSGNVPGFTQAQLTTYLAGRLHEETPCLLYTSDAADE